MGLGRSRLRRSGTPRLRGRALWAFVLAGIALLGTIVGVAQYALSGAVTLRPGEDPLVGADALEGLAALFLVSLGFVVAGILFRSRARRQSRS